MLNATQVCAKFGFTRYRLHGMILTNEFPAPTSKVGMFQFWTAESIEGWTDPRLAKKLVETKKAAVKYRDGDHTWSGRGMMANWLKKHVDAGRSIDEFKV